MGCDYYIYTALKIMHTNGESLIKLGEKPVYLHNYDQEEDTDNMTIHPSKRRPKIDHMKPECDDVLIYKKGEKNTVKYIIEYLELVQELIKDYHDLNYKTKNKIILNNSMFDHDVNGESLKSIDDINEIYIVELRGWRG